MSLVVVRKSTKDADKHKIFYCNLESKILPMLWRHHGMNSRQRSSAYHGIQGVTFLGLIPRLPIMLELTDL